MAARLVVRPTRSTTTHGTPAKLAAGWYSSRSKLVSAALSAAAKLRRVRRRAVIALQAQVSQRGSRQLHATSGEAHSAQCAHAKCEPHGRATPPRNAPVAELLKRFRGPGSLTGHRKRIANPCQPNTSAMLTTSPSPVFYQICASSLRGRPEGGCFTARRQQARGPLQAAATRARGN
jgi:hypothetical protein